MWGALIGDGVGSVYEFDNAACKSDFDLYNPAFHFTDDSVMTLAVMDILYQGIAFDKKKTVDCFRKWGRRYPEAGYGHSFYRWLMSDDYFINDSYGNGAAMRISPLGWFANNQKDLVALSEAITGLSHHHPEGLKGAEVTAMMIYFARKKKSKEELLAYAKSKYALYKSYDELKASNKGHGLEICQVSVPQALSAFFLTNSFDECLQAIVYAGGDTDTTAAIASSIAEAYYGGSDPRLISLASAGFKNDPEATFLLHDPKVRLLFHDAKVNQ
jgi:ADP-ribosylglycohydrolase